MHNEMKIIFLMFLVISGTVNATSFICTDKPVHPPLDAEIKFHELTPPSILNLVMKFPIEIDGKKITGVHLDYGDVTNIYTEKNDWSELSVNLQWQAEGNKAVATVILHESHKSINISIGYEICGPHYVCNVIKNQSKYELTCNAG